MITWPIYTYTHQLSAPGWIRAGLWKSLVRFSMDIWFLAWYLSPVAPLCSRPADSRGEGGVGLGGKWGVEGGGLLRVLQEMPQVSRQWIHSVLTLTGQAAMTHGSRVNSLQQIRMLCSVIYSNLCNTVPLSSLSHFSLYFIPYDSEKAYFKFTILNCFF